MGEREFSAMEHDCMGLARAMQFAIGVHPALLGAQADSAEPSSDKAVETPVDHVETPVDHAAATAPAYDPSMTKRETKIPGRDAQGIERRRPLNPGGTMMTSLRSP